MNFIRAYIRNLFLIAVAIVGMFVFMKIFYPDALAILPFMGQIYSAFNLWPLLILSLLVFALPRRCQR